jgi:hypothetical protein
MADLRFTQIYKGGFMKKIINGKRFDTSKAVEVGEYNNIGDGADSVTDFKFWSATLYRTPRSGQYFLYGEGGPMSRFSQSAGQNSWKGGEDIIPMTKKEAMEWAEQYLSPKEIEEEFGDLIEDA